jgi:hypothetical protein
MRNSKALLMKSPPKNLDKVFITCYLDKIHGAVAQLGERMTGSHEVDGSIPFSSTKDFKGLDDLLTPVF